MSLSCPSCLRTLDTSGERPRFCSYCGQSLTAPTSSERTAAAAGAGVGAETVAYDDAGRTLGFVGRDGAASPPPDRVGGYRLIRPLGSGGMGTVYEAEDSQVGRRVALKLIAPGHLDSDDAVERFRQEGRLASTIAHPRCVFVLAADEDEGRPYIVMELMPGTTLQNLVEDRGALPPEKAIARVLEVIQGLTEAHHLGVLHRDVKPSNCFLDADGRAKVGDFGLSKSLGTASHLTRTGAFIGTPLYSSPEQIRGEALDVRTDVYSVSATLYYLLTGRPPHQASDAASTLAKIVADPVPPIRSIRPEVPGSLDRAVLKGLEKSRDRRHQSLEQLAESIRPFLPGRVSIGSTSLRLAAFFLDLYASKTVVILLTRTAQTIAGRGNRPAMDSGAALSLALDLAIWVVLFGLMESNLGWSPGKRLLNLRVRSAESAANAPRRAVWMRTLTLYLLAGLPVELLMLAELRTEVRILLAAAWAARLVGLVAAASTMRASNGYRGLHEIASGTRVVHLVSTSRRVASIRRAVRPFRAPLRRPAGVLESIGGFRLGGAIRWEPTLRVVLGEDAALRRQVWIVLRGKGAPPPEPDRRDLARPARPRWLTGGDHAEGRWDAYNAPSGGPIVDLAGPGGLTWPDARPILQGLADELAAAEADGTLPGQLSIDQVWVEPDGRCLLVDTLAPPPVAGPPDPGRGVRLLRQVAAIGLEGGRRRSDDAGTPIRAVTPIHAHALLARLSGGPRAIATAAEAAEALRAIGEQPDELGRTQRAGRLAIVGVAGAWALFVVFVLPLLLGAIVDGRLATEPDLDVAAWRREVSKTTWVVDLIVPVAMAAWALATRGRPTLRLLGLEIVRGDGRRASRPRVAWRALMAWLPPSAIVALAVWARSRPPGYPIAFDFLWGLALAWIVADAIVAMLWPARSIHDRLAGTHLVPV